MNAKDKKGQSRAERFAVKVKRILVERAETVLAAAEFLFNQPFESLSADDREYLIRRLGCTVEHAKKAARLSLAGVDKC